MTKSGNTKAPSKPMEETKGKGSKQDLNQARLYLMLLQSIWRQQSKKLKEFIRATDEDRDEFGMSPSFIEWLRPFFQFLYYQYFRVEAVGVENVPPKSPAILVANHSGTLPYDGTMSHLAVFNEHPSKRIVRFLVDDFVFNIPLLKGFIERTGGVRASFDNATRLLDDGNVIMVFPEGVRGVGKTYDQRYQLQRFARGGFVRLAIKAKAPIIPVAIIGAEEIHPLIWKSKALADHIGVPFIPFTPTFPWLGPLGLIPLPSKWKIVFGEPVRFDKFKASDARDDELVKEHAERIRARIQRTLNRELKKRKSIWI